MVPSDLRYAVTGILVLLDASALAQHSLDKEKALAIRRYDWTAALPNCDVPADLESADAVVIDEQLTYEMARLDLPGEMDTRTADVRHYMRTKAITAHGASWLQRTVVPEYRGSRLTLLDARIIRPDGTTSTQAGDLLRARHRFAEGEQRTSREIPLVDLPLTAGDVLELVFQHSGEGLLTAREQVIAGEHPILHKSVVVRAVGIPAPDVDTFNGCPEPEVFAVGDIHERRWTFKRLPPLPQDPLALIKNCAPFMSLRPARYAGYSASGFDARYPRDVLTGRKHMHAFTDYVQDLSTRYAYGDLVGPVVEVVRFIRDSIHLVPDSLLEDELPIGAYFVQRRISRTKLFTMYRSLLRILDLPLYICQARSRYEGRFAETITAQNAPTDEFIAFLDERTNQFHFIYPNRSDQSFLLDELPAYLYGGRVDLLKYSEGALRSESLSLDLAVLKQNPSYQQERIRVEISADGTISSVELRGSLSGQLPIALAADTTEHAREQRGSSLNAWIQRHFTLADVRDLHLERHDAALPAIWKYSGTGRIGQPDRLEIRANDEFTFVPADFVRWALPEFQSATGHPCPRLLPFLFRLRADVVVHGPFPFSMPAGTDTTFTDLFGRFTASAEQPDDHTLVLHYEFNVLNDVVDPSLLPLFRELTDVAQAHLRKGVAIKRTGP